MCSVISNSTSKESHDESDENFIEISKSPTYSHIASSASVSSIPSFPEYDLKPNLSISEIRIRLSELIKHRSQDLVQACRNFDRRLTNKVPKTQLRQVLRTFCFPISAAQFDSLCNEVQLNHVGKINYCDFFKKISNLKHIKVNRTSERIPNDLPVDEIELRIKEKIKSRLADIVRSFWLFDINKDGLIQKTELRRIIRNYCFDLSDNLYDNLWKTYDPKGTGVISYKDFLIKLGINADRYQQYMPMETMASSLCWADKKANKIMKDKSCEQKCRRAALENRDDPIIQGLPIEEILIIFVDRLRRRKKLLKNTFNVFDYEKNGQISFSDFRGIINFFVMAMSPRLFNRVMKRLGIEMPVNSKLTYQDFLESFCDSDSQVKMPEDRTSAKLDCAPVIQKIKNRVLDPYARLHSVFTKLGPDKEWQITRPELKKAVEIGLDIKLTDEEFKELTTILDPGNTNIINCLDFIQLLNGCGADYVNEGGTELSHKVADAQKYSHLEGSKLKSKMKHHLNKNIHNIEKAIYVCDSDLSGFIQPERLKDILSGFCFPLSEAQFQELISDIRNYGERVNYNEFLMKYKKKPDEDIQKWVATVDKLVTYKSRCSPELPVDEAEEILRDCVRSRKTAILKDFRALDVCNVGVACKDDARNVLNKFAFRFSDMQFNELWKNFPCNKYDQLLYEEFLNEYSQPKISFDMKDSASSTGDSVSIDVASKNEKGDGANIDFSYENQKKFIIPDNDTDKPSEIRKSAKEILQEKAPHLKQIFDSMEAAIVRNFRTIRFHLRRADPKVTGIVDFTVLKSILAKSGIYFSKENEFHILEYFDARLMGKINYRDFLRIFVWYA